jgi:hypothetical protein
MAFIGLPRLQMIAGRQGAKPGSCRVCADLDQFRDRELLMRQHVSDNIAVPQIGNRGRRILRLG